MFGKFARERKKRKKKDSSNNRGACVHTKKKKDMYMSVRKPPLSSKTSQKTPTGLRKGEVGTVDQNARHDVPGAPKTSSPPDGARNNTGNAPWPNAQRGGASRYQTTNLLFSGSVLQGEHGGSVTENNNTDNRVPMPPEGEGGVSSGGGGGGAMRNNHGRTVLGRRPQPKYGAKRNVSDNMAAVLGGSVLMNGERLGNGVTRKAFSGPPSTRLQPSQQGGGDGVKDVGVPQRPHPPGSGGTKVGERPTQFVLNANSNQHIPPLVPRSSLVFGQARDNVGATSALRRHGKGKTQNVVDSFCTTHTPNGVGTQFALGSEEGSSQWGKKTSQPFALASIKLQQLASPHRPLSPGIPSDPLGTSLSLRNRPSSSLIAGSRPPCPVPEENTGKSNNVQYEFRVVASTGKTFNSSIKLTAGVGCLQGLRPTMEDEHFIRLNVATSAGQPVSLLGILDGHCGRRVAELASRHVPDNFVTHKALGENNALAFVESIIQADREIFHAMGRGTSNSGSSISCSGSGGSTLIAAAVHGRMLYVACLGDARAVLYDGNKTIPMSEDHKPTTKKEHTRILQCGGFVQFGRVCGVLAVSRALGDYEFKFTGNRFTMNRELIVSNVADVRQINLTDSSKFLLMACDGLWDVVENEEATQFVRDFLRYTPDVGSSPEATKRALNNCCQKLAEFAIDRGSTDNVSVMLLFFHDVADVVAGFDTMGGAHAASPSTSQIISPRLSGPGRGVAFERSAQTTGGGAAKTQRSPVGASPAWHSGGRSIW